MFCRQFNSFNRMIHYNLQWTTMFCIEIIDNLHSAGCWQLNIQALNEIERLYWQCLKLFFYFLIRFQSELNKFVLVNRFSWVRLSSCFAFSIAQKTPTNILAFRWKKQYFDHEMKLTRTIIRISIVDDKNIRLAVWMNGNECSRFRNWHKSTE